MCQSGFWDSLKITEISLTTFQLRSKDEAIKAKRRQFLQKLLMHFWNMVLRRELRSLNKAATPVVLRTRRKGIAVFPMEKSKIMIINVCVFVTSVQGWVEYSEIDIPISCPQDQAERTSSFVRPCKAVKWMARLPQRWFPKAPPIPLRLQFYCPTLFPALHQPQPHFLHQ